MKIHVLDFSSSLNSTFYVSWKKLATKIRTWKINRIENIPLEIICIQNINLHIKSFHFLVNMICFHRFSCNQYNRINRKLWQCIMIYIFDVKHHLCVTNNVGFLSASIYIFSVNILHSKNIWIRKYPWQVFIPATLVYFDLQLIEKRGKNYIYVRIFHMSYFLTSMIRK